MEDDGYRTPSDAGEGGKTRGQAAMLRGKAIPLMSLRLPMVGWG